VETQGAGDEEGGGDAGPYYLAPFAEGIAPQPWSVFAGDCRETMRALAAQGVKVDAVVTDPPFHLVSIQKRFGKKGSAPAQFGRDGAAGRLSDGFNGMMWDGSLPGETPIAFDPATWRLVLGMLRPGGRLLAFGGTRTGHRTACAIEDAGFELAARQAKRLWRKATRLLCAKPNRNTLTTSKGVC
jgi:DNA modification methylase